VEVIEGTVSRRRTPTKQQLDVRASLQWEIDMHKNNYNDCIIYLWKSFDSVIYPGDNNIVYRDEFYHKFGEYYEPRFIELLLNKVPNKLLDIQIISKYEHDKSAILAFLTREAFQYYIPSFINMCIINKKYISIIFGSVIYNLTLPNPDETNKKTTRENFLDRAVLFTEVQCRAIYQCLDCMSLISADIWGDNEEVIQARDSYWHKFR
jgi:hypothetical protein